ncbi:MAG: GNAT family N-acetyltransferase [Anaerolineae bacterium]|nr:GNAT family N-acetyltransferase [Anaerolineae bacterium]
MTLDAAFTHFPTLTTERLSLRRIQVEDAAAVFAIKSNPAVTHAYGREPHPAIENSLGWIQRLQTYYAEREALVWGITFKGQAEPVIGSCTFWNFTGGFRCAELGYELHPDYWGQGIMSEVLPAILAFGFRELDLHRIEANTMANNAASLSLLRRAGFIEEGRLRERIFFQGQFTDEVYFGLLQEEWRQR